MKYVIIVTLDGGETTQVFAETETSGRIAYGLFATCTGIQRIELRHVAKGKPLLVYGEPGDA